MVACLLSPRVSTSSRYTRSTTTYQLRARYLTSVVQDASRCSGGEPKACVPKTERRRGEEKGDGEGKERLHWITQGAGEGGSEMRLEKDG